MNELGEHALVMVITLLPGALSDVQPSAACTLVFGELKQTGAPLPPRKEAGILCVPRCNKRKVKSKHACLRTTHLNSLHCLLVQRQHIALAKDARCHALWVEGL